MTKTTRSTDSVQVSFWVLREIKIDDNVNCLDIDTSRDEIRRYQESTLTFCEIMEYFIALHLIHLCMNEEAAVALLDDFLCEQLNALCTVTEDDALIDLKLFEKVIHKIIIYCIFMIVKK